MVTRDRLQQLWSARITRVYSTGYAGTRGIFGGRTELFEVSGIGIKFVPNHTGVLGRVLRPYRTLMKILLQGSYRANAPGILGYGLNTLPNTPFGRIHTSGKYVPGISCKHAPVIPAPLILSDDTLVTPAPLIPAGAALVILAPVIPGNVGP